MLRLVNLWSEEHAADIRSLIAGGELQADSETYMYALGKEVVYHQLSHFIDDVLTMLAKRNENN